MDYASKQASNQAVERSTHPDVSLIQRWKTGSASELLRGRKTLLHKTL